jgi:hypothetical protein
MVMAVTYGWKLAITGFPVSSRKQRAHFDPGFRAKINPSAKGRGEAINDKP